MCSFIIISNWNPEISWRLIISTLIVTTLPSAPLSFDNISILVDASVKFATNVRSDVTVNEYVELVETTKSPSVQFTK